MLTVKDPIRYQVILEFLPLQRKEVARFLGVDFGQVSRDCNLLGLAPRTPLQIHEIYALWLVRLEIVKGTPRRHIREAAKSEYGREEIARIQSELLNTPEKFLDDLLAFINFDKGLELKQPEPETLKKHRMKFVPRIPQRLAARILNTSQSTVSRIAHAIADERGMTEETFEEVFARFTLFKCLRIFKPKASRRSLFLDNHFLNYLVKLTNDLGLTNDLAINAFYAALDGIVNPIDISFA